MQWVKIQNDMPQKVVMMFGKLEDQEEIEGLEIPGLLVWPLGNPKIHLND